MIAETKRISVGPTIEPINFSSTRFPLLAGF